MAVRLRDQVVRGEIFNTQRYSTHGWLELRGADRPLLLQLTGNCSPDLAGWHFRFETKNIPESGFHTKSPSLEQNDEGSSLVSDSLAESSNAELKDSEPNSAGSLEDQPSGGGLENLGIESSDICGLNWEQIGPTGTMTADRQVRVFDCSFEEFYRRTKLDELPPSQWKRCLYLEWYSQNGRVVLELPDPILEFVERVDWTSGQNVGEGSSSTEIEADYLDSETSESGLGITEIHLNEDGHPEINNRFFSEQNDEDDLDDDDFAENSAEKEDDDPFNLFPADLQKQLDTQAYHTDWLLQGESEDGEKSDAIRDLELMDFLIENSDGEHLDSFCHVPVPLDKLDSHSEEQVERALKDILAQMALYGVALDMCKHYSARRAYRLLLEEILPEQNFYPELKGTRWVQHYCTHEFCPECDAEMEKEFQEREQRRKEHPEEFSNLSSDDDKNLNDGEPG